MTGAESHRKGLLARIVGLWLVVTLLASLGSRVWAQDTIPDAPPGVLVPYMLVDGDTVPVFAIQKVVVVRPRRFKNKRQLRAYNRMIANLKITYPYAQKAKVLLKEMDSVYANEDSKRAKRKYAYQKEKELYREFESQIRNLTYSQGRMLMKLINRETGRTSYEIIKQFRGGISAGFWQGVAKLFSSDLKSEFDPEEEDKILNELILLYENGQL